MIALWVGDGVMRGGVSLFRWDLVILCCLRYEIVAGFKLDASMICDIVTSWI